MSMQFITPRDGQMLTDTAGERRGDALAIDVALAAEPGRKIFINNRPAEWRNGAYHVSLELDGYRNTVEAIDSDGDSVKMGIYWIPQATHGFALSVDDNIWWLQDLTDNDYASLFDNPYLAVYKEAHDAYGVCVRFNLFCTTDRRGGFDLSGMTDRYREEFLANHDWLHLAFHADTEFPDEPYSETTYAKLKYDYDRINTEVRRFAGYDLEHATTIHWGSGNRQAIRAIRSRGVHTLMGYMELENGRPFVSYYLTPEEIDLVCEFGFWKDHGEDMIFGRIDAVLNLYEPRGIIERLEECARRFPKKGYVEIMIHEQYFYPDYPAHKPDFRERIMTGCRWCVEHGYHPMFSCDAARAW